MASKLLFLFIISLINTQLHFTPRPLYNSLKESYTAKDGDFDFMDLGVKFMVGRFG